MRLASMFRDTVKTSSTYLRNLFRLVFGLRFSCKGVFDPVRCVRVRHKRTNVCVDCVALFSFHYGRVSRFYILIIVDAPPGTGLSRLPQSAAEDYGESGLCEFLSRT